MKSCGRSSVRRSVVVAVALSLVVASCSSGGSGDSLDPSRPSTNTQGADSVESESVASLRTLAGEPFEGAAIVEVPSAALEGLPAGFTPAGPAADITVADGLVTEPLVLTVPGEAPPSNSVAVMLHRNDAGSWEANPAVYEEGGYVAEVSSFSPQVPGFIAGAFDSASDWLTGRSDPPEDCEADPYGWVATQGAGPADGSFHACVRANPMPGSNVERVEVKIKSNRSMAMWIVIPEAPHDYLWVESLGDWEFLAPVITELDTAFGRPRVLLPPGRTMTMGFTRPVGEGPKLEFSSYQNNTTQLVSLTNKYVGDAGIYGAIAAMLWCVSDESIRQGKDVRFSEMSLDVAMGCVPKFLTVAKDLGGRVLDTTYRSMVAEGRFRLSVGASDGIESLIDDATKKARMNSVLTRLSTFTKALTAAQLVADATSMAQDTALAFTPGLNTYTVFLVGSPRPETAIEDTYDDNRPYWIVSMDLAAGSMRVQPVVNWFDYTELRYGDVITVRLSAGAEVHRVMSGSTVDIQDFANYVNSRDPATPTELADLVAVPDGSGQVGVIFPWLDGGDGEGVDWEYCASIGKGPDANGELQEDCSLDETSDGQLTSCEGLDMSLVPDTGVSVIQSVCSFPWALVAFTEPEPRLAVALIQTLERTFITYWVDVEDGPEISNYSVESITSYGVPRQSAQAMWEALGGAAAGG